MTFLFASSKNAQVVVNGVVLSIHVVLGLRGQEAWNGALNYIQTINNLS